MLKIAFAGTRTFGATALRLVCDLGHEVAFVAAPPDDKKMAQAIRDKRLQLATGSMLDNCRATQPDLIVCAHSHAFVSRQAREQTRLGGIGYHPSLLPRHRGRDAVRWTIHMRDPIAGGSVYWLTDNVDGGPIAAQDWCFVDPRWDASDLWRKQLFPMGLRLLQKTLTDIDNGLLVEIDQDERYATWEPSWERPPLYRPDLPQIGSGPRGFVVRKRRY